MSLLILQVYRSTVGLFFGGNCRFEPTCSAYAVQAFERHEFFVALKLTFVRLLKCHPWGPFGFDPVPNSRKELIRE